MKTSQIRVSVVTAASILLFAHLAMAASVSGSNPGNVNIPDGGSYVSSTITISGAPAGATVTGIDVYFRCVHPYSGDLVVDLNADATGNLGNRNLWNREGAAADNPTRTTTGITTFNGLSVNRTWYLYAKDFVALDSGYIDDWTITVYYAAVTPTTSTIAVSASPSAGGTVSGSGTYTSGSSRTVTAMANSGYTFVNWTESGSAVSSSASYTFTLSGNRTLVANFTANPLNYTISVGASPSTGGTVSGGGTFVSGSSRTVTATANSSYTFVNWTENGSAVSSSASYNFTLSGNRNLVANFTGSGGVVRIPGTIPYTRQNGDTPDAFNGAGACGAASAVMVAAYYGRLVQHAITVTKFTAFSDHPRNYGWYIAPYNGSVATTYSAYGYTYDTLTTSTMLGFLGNPLPRIEL